MVIKNGKHVILGNITLPPGFGNIAGVRSIVERCAKIGEIGSWQRGHGRNTRCQNTCSTRYAEKQKVYGIVLNVHVLFVRIFDRMYSEYS